MLLENSFFKLCFSWVYDSKFIVFFLNSLTLIHHHLSEIETFFGGLINVKSSINCTAVCMSGISKSISKSFGKDLDNLLQFFPHLFFHETEPCIL
jgi:hypothetical protein